MNITNQKLIPYNDKLVNLINTLVDSNVSIPVRKTRITDVKNQVLGISDYLINAKNNSRDPIFNAEIDSIITNAKTRYETASNFLMTANTNPLPEENKSESAKYLDEMNNSEITKSITITDTEVIPVVTSSVRSFDPKPQTNLPIEGITIGNEKGYFVLTSIGSKYFQDDISLKVYITQNYVGTKLPIIIKGELIQPKVSIDLGLGDTV